ncbi:hypothetical protein OH807_16770 [Kitasatospora sp. NBC_01560]|uniref:hypothetical protein n=1 Tax=Kitasatospora sp. NBC_01560 TaxID=2975965 RepID=UPI00386BE707
MSSGDDTGERNPFAPPPADAPEQPWRPRDPGASGGPDAPDGEGPDERPLVPPPHPWSPGYQGGRGSRPSGPQPPKLDPADPAQRKARNAALAGMGALICAFAALHYVALFVGALAIVWGVGAMRTPRPAPGRAAVTGAAPAPAAAGPNPLTPAALAGVLTGAMTVVFVSSVIGLSLYYNDYVTCVRDSLTATGADNCDRLAPKWYVDVTTKSD